MEVKKTKGRPKKKDLRSQFVAVKCTIEEKKCIVNKAKLLHVSMSQYLREGGISGQINIKRVPKEILELKGMLYSLAANVNQLAKKRNQGLDLNAFERAALTTLVTSIKALLSDIKIYLQ